MLALLSHQPCTGSAHQQPLPTGVRSSNGKLTWNAATSEIRGWTLYPQNGNTWTLRQILPAAITTTALPSGTYAL
ncbi:MAG: hypothetical protein H7Z11_04370 [Verrucomicrobia bacterium]|nr:hypothetical protein [Leptolyngbya sp. ES-bin-22]